VHSTLLHKWIKRKSHHNFHIINQRRSPDLIEILTPLQFERPELAATAISKCNALRFSVADASRVASAAQVRQIAHRLAHRTRGAVWNVDDANSLDEIRRFTLAYTAHALTNGQQRTRFAIDAAVRVFRVD
jgi:hypothetical protein